LAKNKLDLGLQWKIQNLVINPWQSSKLAEIFVQNLTSNTLQVTVFDWHPVQNLLQIDKFFEAAWRRSAL
jgi:hypothetical protein